MLDSAKPRLLLWSHFTLTIILSTLSAIVGYIALEVFFPSLPAIAKGFGVSQGASQLTVAAYLTSFGLSQLFYGPLSDYWGRRPLLLTGLLLYFFGSLACLYTLSFSGLIAGRLLQGLGAGACASLSRVILRDLSSGNKMAQLASFLSTMIALTTAMAPGLGGLLQEWYGYQANFIVMLAFGIMVLVLSCFFLPETNPARIGGGIRFSVIRENAKEVLRNTRFLCYVAYAGLALAVLVASASINPFLLQNVYGYSASHYGLLAVIIAFGELVGTLINAWLVLRFGLDRMLSLGFLIIMLAGLGLMTPLPLSPVVHIVVFCFLGAFGTALIFPSASAGGFSSFSKNIGLVGAIYGFSQILFCALSSYSISLFQLESVHDLGMLFILASLIGLSLKALGRF